MKAIVPIGGLFAITLWLSNAAYLYLSVSFIQVSSILSRCANQGEITITSNKQNARICSEANYLSKLIGDGAGCHQPAPLPFLLTSCWMLGHQGPDVLPKPF